MWRNVRSTVGHARCGETRVRWNDFLRNTQTAINRIPRSSWATCTRRAKLRVWHVMDARGAVCCLDTPSLTRESPLPVSKTPLASTKLKRKKKIETNCSTPNVSIAFAIFHVLQLVAVGIVNVLGYTEFGFSTCSLSTRSLFTACG